MKAERPYHHGHLKQTLLNAALALISEVGPQAFTLREVARRADVSHNAPYRHFRDKDELLAVVAVQFLVMFDLPLSRDKYPEYAKAGDEAFATLLALIVECQEAGVLSRGDPEPMALMAWSMVHGIAKLAASSHLPFPRDGILDFTDAATRVITAGMGRA